MDFKLRTPESIKQVSDTLSAIVPRYAYGAVKEETLNTPLPAQQEETPQFGYFEGQ